MFRILPSGERETATPPQLALYCEWVSLIADGDKTELYDLKADPRAGKEPRGRAPRTWSPHSGSNSSV